jgi:circadian clock protein KaiB
MATPTLIRVMPQPVRRVVGDLSDETQVRVGLDIPGGGRPSEDE